METRMELFAFIQLSLFSFPIYSREADQASKEKVGR